MTTIDEKRFCFPREARPLAHDLLADVLRDVELGRESASTLCDALAQTGVVESFLGDYPEAAGFLLRGLKLSRILEDPVREVSLLLRCVTLLTGLEMEPSDGGSWHALPLSSRPHRGLARPGCARTRRQGQALP